ncbi:FtsX-like permease family protein, partial [Streptomyces polyrhachis]
DLATARPSRRRTVAELTVLALAVGGIAALRRRGAAGSGEVDALLSAASVLAAVAAAAVFVRLYPLPLRMAGRPAAGWRGAVGFLSLARAGRTHAAAALPLLALLIALTTASFGGSVLAGVEHARERAALYAAGADARIESPPGKTLPEGFAAKVQKVRGVDDAVAVRVEPGFPLGASGELVSLVLVRPEEYARLAERLGFGTFRAAELTRGDQVSSLPALTSPHVAETAVEGVFTMQPPMGQLRLRAAAELDGTPAWPGGAFVVVNAEQIAKDYPEYTAGPAAGRPNLLLVAGGSIDAAALRAAVKEARAGSVTLQAETKAGFGESPLQRGAERLYAVASLAGIAFAVLAVLMSLLQAAPERTALLARLRTMGLPPAHGRRLLVLEALPQVLLAGAVGALLGVASVRLVEPGVELGVLAGALSTSSGLEQLLDARLTPDPAALLLPSLVIPAVVLAAVLGQAWWTWRQRAATELRAGDRE